MLWGKTIVDLFESIFRKCSKSNSAHEQLIEINCSDAWERLKWILHVKISMIHSSDRIFLEKKRALSESNDLLVDKNA